MSMTMINNPTDNTHTGGGYALGCAAAVKRGFGSLAFFNTVGDFESSVRFGSSGAGKVVDGIALSNSGCEQEDGIALSNSEGKPVDGIALSNSGCEQEDGIALSNIEHEPVDGIALSNSESDTEDYT